MSNNKIKEELESLTSEEKPEVCGINEDFKPEKEKIDLGKVPGQENPEVCGIDESFKPEKIDLGKVPGQENPEVCGINTSFKPEKIDLGKVPGQENPEVCGINKNFEPEKIDLGKVPGQENPEVCGINKNFEPKKLDLGNLPGEKHPSVCSIDTNTKETGSYNIPNIDEQRSQYESMKIRKEEKAELIKELDEGKITILDTYDFNIPATAEEREKLLEELSKTDVYDSYQKSKFEDLSKPLITIVKNGPYIVHGGIPIVNAEIKTDSQGQSVGWKDIIDLKHQEPVVLCRCGQSKHEPFCDDTHIHIHFDGTCTASNKPYNEEANIYRGCQGVYLMDEVSLCAIVRFCDPDGSCWNLVKNKLTLEKALEESYNCASGRLTIVKDGKKQEPELKQEIECIYDTERDVLGPLWVKGGIPVKNEDTDYEIRNRVTLCRCGRSYNKPFCDGMHLTCKKLTPEEVKEDDL